MDGIPIDEAKARLAALIDEVEAGATIEISRGGRVVARLTGVATPRRPVDLARLQALTASQSEAPGGTVREMRDSDRY